ncbi:MAG: hypothetical protein K6V97_03065 [Actinomycetia bacterium]|nr:hypothetical protein [Actinomycetes bacterium]
MGWPSTRPGRILVPLLLTLALGGSAYAYMASNGVSASSAGSGGGPISGYTVGGITYGLNMTPGDPDGLINVAFSVTPAPGGQPATSVAVWFDNDPSHVASSTQGTCRKIGGPTDEGVTYWSCDLNLWNPSAGATVLDVAAAH